MSREAIGTLMDKWTNDPAFRKQLRADPEGAVKRSGASLSADELASLRNIDWSLPDEQLQARASKY